MSNSQASNRNKIIGILKEFSKTTTFSDIEETAVPSYVHKNPLVRSLFWGRINALIGAVTKLVPNSVFDFGCGSGITTALLDPSMHRSVYDIYYPPYNFMRDRLTSLQNVKQLTSPDLVSLNREFDVIIAADVLEHLHREELLEQILKFHKWVKPAGHIVISGPTENIMYKIGRAIAGYSGHYHHMTIHDIDRAFLGTGRFARVSSKRYPVPFILEGFLVLTYRHKPVA